MSVLQKHVQTRRVKFFKLHIFVKLFFPNDMVLVILKPIKAR